jgi:hypothetical protein
MASKFSFSCSQILSFYLLLTTPVLSTLNLLLLSTFLLYSTICTCNLYPFSCSQSLCFPHCKPFYFFISLFLLYSLLLITFSSFARILFPFSCFQYLPFSRFQSLIFVFSQHHSISFSCYQPIPSLAIFISCF